MKKLLIAALSAMILFTSPAYTSQSQSQSDDTVTIYVARHGKTNQPRFVADWFYP